MKYSFFWPVNLALALLFASSVRSEDQQAFLRAGIAKLQELAGDHVKAGEYYETVRVVDRILLLDPDNALAYVRRAYAHDKMGDYGPAMDDYAHAFRLGADNEMLHLRRAEVGFRAGRFKESVADYDKYISLEPREERHLSTRALSLYYHGDYIRAAKQCELSYNPFLKNDEMALIHFLSHLRLHGLEVAKQRSLELRGNGTTTAQLLYDVFQEKQTADQLLKRFEDMKPMQRSKSASHIHYFLALWHDVHGRKKEVKASIDKAYAAVRYEVDHPIDEAIRVHRWLLMEKRPPHPPSLSKRIVYVVDASGSTVDTLPFIINELRTSINSLSERQAVSVLFFQHGDYLEPLGPGYKSISYRNRTNLFKWMDLESGQLVPQGSSDPRAAIARAFELKPSLIFIVSDDLTGRGRFELNQKALRADIVKLNEGRYKINAIQFLRTGQTVNDAKWLPTLKHIATDSGGLYKYVSPREIGFQE